MSTEKLLMIPSGYKATKLYSQKPTDGTGDFTVSRNSTATRVNSSDIIESVGVNIPRLDYSDGVCPVLLLEPQRTNLISYSEYIGAWTPSGLTISDNEATSPEGVLNGAKLTLPSGSAQKRIALGSIPVTSVARSYSFFVKSDDITAVQLVHSGDLQGYARFDISTGVVGSTGTKTTSDIEDYGNGWYRCIANFDSTNAFGATIYLYINDSATGGYGGSTSAAGDLFVYGAQYEEGSYPTSYIPTYGTSVTRIADVVYKTGISSLIGQQEGVVFVDFEVTDPASSQPINIYNNNKAADTISTISIQFNMNTVTAVLCLGNGTFDSISLTGVGYGLNQRLKVAFKYKSGDLALYVNGVQKDTDAATYTAIGTKSEIFLGDPTVYFAYKGGFKLYGYLQFPASLTNAQLAELTT